MINRRGLIDKYHWIILSTLWVAVHVLLFTHYGIRNPYDTIDYIQHADSLNQSGRFSDIEHIFYAVPIIIIAAFRWLFPEQILPFLIFQCIISGISVVALYKASVKVFDNRSAGLFSCLLFLLWWDYIHWNTTAMTESLACSFTIFTLYFLVFFRGSWKDFCKLSLPLILLFFTRPTAIIIILGVLVFMLNYFWNFIKSKPVWKLLIVTGLICIIFLSAYVMSTYWDFTEQYAKGNIITYADIVEGGPLYNEHLKILPYDLQVADAHEAPMKRMLLFIVYNPVFFLKLAVWKVWFLMSSVRPYYSFLHNAYSLTWVLGIYTLYFLGWKRTEEKSVKIFTLAVIVANCGLIAISSVDWDNRFYILMEPGLVLLAGGGAASIWQSLKKTLLNSSLTSALNHYKNAK